MAEDETLKDLARAVATEAAEEFSFSVPPAAEQRQREQFEQIVERHVLATLEHVEDEGEKLSERRRVQALEAIEERNKANRRSGRADAEARHERARVFTLDKRLLEVGAELDVAQAKLAKPFGLRAEIRNLRQQTDELRKLHALEIQRRRSQEVLAAERLELIEECARALDVEKDKVEDLEKQFMRAYGEAAENGQKWQDATELAIERQKTIVTLREQRDRAEKNWHDATQRSIVRANEIWPLQRKVEALKREAEKRQEWNRTQSLEVGRLRGALERCHDHCGPVDRIVAEALGS